MKKNKSKARSVKSSRHPKRRLSSQQFMEGGNDLTKIILAAVAGLLIAVWAYFTFTAPAQTPSQPVENNMQTNTPVNLNQTP
jgi:hypothetical protein